MVADNDPVEKSGSSSASENLENLESEFSLRLAEAAKSSERRGELEIQRLKLRAAVADFDERLAKLQEDSALTAGQKTIHRAYLQHLREKTLISIRLMQLEQKVAGARFKHTVSKTPGAQKNWRNHQQMRRQGAAFGGGHPARRQGPLPLAKGPEEEALGRLLDAESEYRDARAKLFELCKKDSYFESLSGAELNHRGVSPPTPAEAIEPRRASAPQASGSDIDGATGLNYRSHLRIAVWSQLVKNPRATDLDICRGLDFDGDVKLPMGWRRKSFKHSVSQDYLFKEAYGDPQQRKKIHSLISKVRRDMRNRGLR
ncbi:MAG TPA: hypothetical protein VII23_00660 [Terriglobales bacterium]